MPGPVMAKSRKTSKRVWFARARAAVWSALTPCALLWWPTSVAFVIVASMYANVTSDLAIAEAADNTVVLDRLDRLEGLMQQVLEHLAHRACRCDS